MSVVVIGLNHRTAPLELLERMVIGDVQMSKALHDPVSYTHLTLPTILRV